MRVAAQEGSRTHCNLKHAFAREAQANRRHPHFAQNADVEGRPDVSALFRSVAGGETGHAFGHLDFLADAGDPLTDVPIGFGDVAEWFEALARAETSHAGCLRQGLDGAG